MHLHSLNFEIVVLIPTTIANRPFKGFYLFIYLFILYILVANLVYKLWYYNK